ncbi:MAG TPA: HU family DNA-binding protein [Ignavibacteriales bacterium]|nr:HU family DNA-binding protein [Ignavibacteriales bacterium]
MRKEKILHKIQDALGISEAESNYAVKELLDKIQERTDFGGAVKIPKIGVFALTKLRNPDFIYAEEEPVLLYNDPNDYEFEDSYSAISLPETAGDTLIDKSFSISVNKPLAPIWEKDALAGHSFVVVQKILESKIDGLLDISEKIENFEPDKRAPIVKLDLYTDIEAKAKSEAAGIVEAEEEIITKEIPYSAPDIQKEPEQAAKEDIAEEQPAWEEKFENVKEELAKEKAPDNSGYMEFEWNFGEEVKKEEEPVKENIVEETKDINEEVVERVEEKVDEGSFDEPIIEPQTMEPEIIPLAPAQEPEIKTESEIEAKPEENKSEENALDEKRADETKPDEDKQETIAEEALSNEKQEASKKTKEEPMEEAVIIEEETVIGKPIGEEPAARSKKKKRNHHSESTPFNYEDEFMEEEESRKKLSPAFWIILILLLAFTGGGLYYFFIEPAQPKKTEAAEVKIEPKKANQTAAAEKTPTGAADNKAAASKAQTNPGTAKTQTPKAPAQTAANQQKQPRSESFLPQRFGLLSLAQS